MSSIVKKILYIVLIVAFTSSFISGNAILIPETDIYAVSLFGSNFEITAEIFEITNSLASALNYAALLVIINVINMTNKNSEITQGSLDQKQNMTLSNQAWIMDGLQYIIKTNNIGDANKKIELIDAYKNRIPLTITLSNTSIDFKTVDIETKIFNIKNTIEGLDLSIAEAKLINDTFTMKILNIALAKAQATLADYTKKINV